jgi:hypothetical protein
MSVNSNSPARVHASLCMFRRRKRAVNQDGDKQAPRNPSFRGVLLSPAACRRVVEVGRPTKDGGARTPRAAVACRREFQAGGPDEPRPSGSVRPAASLDCAAEPWRFSRNVRARYVLARDRRSPRRWRGVVLQRASSIPQRRGDFGVNDAARGSGRQGRCVRYCRSFTFGRAPHG